MSDPNAAHHESNRHFYDRIAAAYDLIADANERAARQAGVRALGLAAGEDVLELGFGTGNEVLEFAELVGPTGRVAGVDVSPGMLAVANRKLAVAAPKARVDLRVADLDSKLAGHGRPFGVHCVVGFTQRPAGEGRHLARQAQDCCQRQRNGADQQRHSGLGRANQGRLALHRTGQADAERLRRKFQRSPA